MKEQRPVLWGAVASWGLADHYLSWYRSSGGTLTAGGQSVSVTSWLLLGQP